MDDADYPVDDPQQIYFTLDWEIAVERWLNSEHGENWPGGEHNRDAIIAMVNQLGLVESSDKEAALTIARDEAQSRGLLVDSDEGEHGNV